MGASTIIGQVMRPVIGMTGVGVVLIVVAAFVIWVVPIWLAARITDERGRGVTSGVLLGFCLGWIGVLVAIAIGRPAADVRVALPTQSGGGAALRMRRCTTVGCSRRDRSTTDWDCQSCGKPTTATAVLSRPAAPPAQSNHGLAPRMRRCTAVGCPRRNRSTTDWDCPSCGKPTTVTALLSR